MVLIVLQQEASAPGALFEDKPHSANDAWRKLHSDPLLMIRQREQEALAKIKNNPIKMAMIRKSVSQPFFCFGIVNISSIHICAFFILYYCIPVDSLIFQL